MNSSQYLRQILKTQTKIIGFQNGQDASQVTLKNQARAQTTKTPVSVATNFSKIGGTVANVMEATQQNNTPTTQVCTSGYQGVSGGIQTTDATANIIGAKQHCAVCADPPSSAPYSIVLPCGTFINPIAYNTDDSATIDPTTTTPGSKPGNVKCCQKDMGQIFRDNSELVADQGRQLAIRRQYGGPPKLQGLRGPIISR